MAKLKSRKLESPVWPIVVAVIVACTVSNTVNERLDLSFLAQLGVAVAVGALVGVIFRIVRGLPAPENGQPEELDA